MVSIVFGVMLLLGVAAVFLGVTMMIGAVVPNWGGGEAPPFGGGFLLAAIGIALMVGAFAGAVAN